MDQRYKKCPRCDNEYPLTEDYFYPARKLNRNKIGWQSYCKNCWKGINYENKQRIKQERFNTVQQFFTLMGGS